MLLSKMRILVLALLLAGCEHDGVTIMQQVPVMVDGATSLAADEFNDIPREEENLIQSADITLDGGDLNQMGKAVAQYAGGADFYTDTGAANAYVLETIDDFQEVPFYKPGLRVRFIPANDSTSTTVTVQLGSLASLPVSNVKLPNGGTPVSSLDYFKTGVQSELVYEKTDDSLTEYWRSLETSLSRITEGTMSFTEDLGGSQEAVIDFGSTQLRMQKGQAGGPYNEEIELTPTNIDLIDANNAEDSKSTPGETIFRSAQDYFTHVSGRGVRYKGGFGTAATWDYYHRKAVYLIQGVGATWVNGSSGNGTWSHNGVSFDLDIPTGWQILGASINWIDASGKLHVASAWIQLDESATTPGFYEVEVVTVTTGYNTIKPRDNESYLLIIEFDASNAI